MLWLFLCVHQCYGGCNGGFRVSAAGLPGCARLELAQGVVPLNPQEAVFEGMLAGWARQQRSRFLREQATIGRLRARTPCFAEAAKPAVLPSSRRNFAADVIPETSTQSQTEHKWSPGTDLRKGRVTGFMVVMPRTPACTREAPCHPRTKRCVRGSV
jgi:hypothetical protein